VTLLRPENFRAVGQFYARFGAVSDAAVAQLSDRGRNLGRPPSNAPPPL
jgi:predicted phosphoribosyltransferase